MALPQAGPLKVEQDGMMRFGTSGPAAQLAVDALTSGLAEGPLAHHWSRDSAAGRRAFCDAYIRGSLRDSGPRLQFLAAGGAGAIVATLLPDQQLGRLAGAWAGLRLLLAAVPFAKWREFAAFNTYLSAKKQSLQQEHGAFIHVVAIGTRPEAQGQGIGSQLLARVLAHADAHSLPAYLETGTERARRLYLRHGFRDMEIWHGGIPLFLMWRPAGGGPVAAAGRSTAETGTSATSAPEMAAGRQKLAEAHQSLQQAAQAALHAEALQGRAPPAGFQC